MLEHLDPAPGEIRQSKEATQRLHNSLADGPVPERRTRIGFNWARADVGTPQVFTVHPSINQLISATEAAGSSNYGVLPGRMPTQRTDGEPGAAPAGSGGY